MDAELSLSGRGCGPVPRTHLPQQWPSEDDPRRPGLGVYLSRHDLWAYAKGVALDFSRPGKPTDNAFIEAFNGRFRAECLNAHWFLTLDDARSKMEDWRKYYNEVRPLGVIGNKPPITLQDYEGVPSSPS